MTTSSTSTPRARPGLPKAAKFSHLRFLAIGELVGWGMKLTPADVHYCALPLYHTAGGVMVVSSVLASGCTMVLRRKFSASEFWKDVREHGATCFQYIVSSVAISSIRRRAPTTPTTAFASPSATGSGPDIWEEFQRRFGIDTIVEFYGATEGNTALVNLENKVGSVGRMPFDFMTNAKLVRYDVENDTHLRDDRGFCIECGPGEPGELLGKIPTSTDTAQGRYEGYTSKEASEKKILRDVLQKATPGSVAGIFFASRRRGLLSTSSIASVTPSAGRAENVSTQEVAEALSSFPGSRWSTSTGSRCREAMGVRVWRPCFLTRRPGDSFDAAAFHATWPRTCRATPLPSSCAFCGAWK